MDINYRINNFSN